MMRAALLQMTASDEPDANVQTLRAMVGEAIAEGAGFVLTPEVTNCVSSSRSHQASVLRLPAEDPTLAAGRELAAKHGIWLLLGSLALKAEPPETRFVNRSFLINPNGEIAAWYDKMHMFDVQVTETETYCESAGYAPGARAVVAQTPFGKVGLSICYDIRFSYLYRALAQAGAQILTVPAAFSPATGPAHWRPLLQARAIENGAYVLAPAQTGDHAVTQGRPRRTHGHSLAVGPWGEVLVDAGAAPGVTCVDLDLAHVAAARSKVPSLSHDRDFEPPR